MPTSPDRIMLFEFNATCGGVPVCQIGDNQHFVLCAENDTSKMDYQAANELCSSSRINGFDDWIIPSISHLSVLHTLKNHCHFYFSDGWCWSSDVFTAHSQWIVDVNNGSVSTSYHDKKLLLVKARIHTGSGK